MRVEGILKKRPGNVLNMKYHTENNTKLCFPPWVTTYLSIVPNSHVRFWDEHGWRNATKMKQNSHDTKHVHQLVKIEIEIGYDYISSLMLTQFQKYWYVWLFTESEALFIIIYNIVWHLFQNIWTFNDHRLICSRFSNKLRISYNFEISKNL